MKKIFAGAFALIFSFSINAQLKELTLEDAVSGSRKFRPTSMVDFNWMPDSQCCSYLSENYSHLLKGSAKGNDVDTIISVNEFNEIAGTET